MQLVFTRFDVHGRYVTQIARDDGVRFSVQGVGHNFELPHDLAHGVIEHALQIKDGFWGSVAAGAVFPSMTFEGGRRKPKAAERSRIVLRTNARALVEAEIVVSLFDKAISEKAGEGLLRRRLCERLAHRERRLTAQQIAASYSAYTLAKESWDDLKVGCSMTLFWKT